MLSAAFVNGTLRIKLIISIRLVDNNCHHFRCSVPVDIDSVEKDYDVLI